MLRKILFIAINYIDSIEILTKVVLLLFFSSIFIILTVAFEPFMLGELNLLELYSNISVYINIFSGAFYLQDSISEGFKICLFSWIMITDGIFGFYWAFLCGKLFFFRYFSFFQKYFPKITRKIMNWKKSSKWTKKRIAQFYFKQMKAIDL